MTTVTNEYAHQLPITNTDTADLSSAIYDTTTTAYAGPYIYQNDTLRMLLTEEGYISFDNAGTPTYHYYVKDYLSSNRVVINQNGTVEQVNHYYPFGMEFNENGHDDSKQPYRFGGKEEQGMHRLNLYDSHKRQLSVSTPSFTTIDPFVEKYYNWSPYAYALCNPMRNIDIKGDSAWSVVREWNESDIQNFATYAQTRLQEYEGQDIDCADLSLSVLIDYASENGLALNITTAGGRSFDSNSDNYNSIDDYKNGYTNNKGEKKGGVLPNVQATDIPSNTFTLDKKNAQPGDMVVLTEPANHVVNYSQTSPTRKLTYGNMTNGKPSAVKTRKTDWTNTTRDTRGVVYKYNPNNKTVHRWNYLNSNR